MKEDNEDEAQLEEWMRMNTREGMRMEDDVEGAEQGDDEVMTKNVDDKMTNDKDDELTDGTRIEVIDLAKMDPKTGPNPKDMIQSTLKAHKEGVRILIVRGKKVEMLGKAMGKTKKAGPKRKDQLNLEDSKIGIFERAKRLKGKDKDKD